ncbi:MAG: AsnC family transcriptional regulator [Gammaproteobacteria bacterium]|nr:AsnC family transcriptional regulator [Gammaproteobacteria bacterium]
MPIDAIDRQIIEATQSGLPLVEQPYVEVAQQIGISEAEVMQRICAMQEKDIIRRIGVVPNHYALGYKANGMTVWDVPDEHIAELGKKIGTLEFVSHCYQRPRFLPEWPYNLFAMVHAGTKEEAMQQVDVIAELLGDMNRQHDVLFSTKILKKTGLRLKSK